MDRYSGYPAISALDLKKNDGNSNKMKIKCFFHFCLEIVLLIYPGEDGEEGEGNGSSGSIRSLIQGQLIWGGALPLVGQEAETNKPQKCPETCSHAPNTTTRIY